MPNDTMPVPGSLVPSGRRTLAPTTFSEALEFAKQLAQSSMIPAEYRGRPENIVLAMQWGLELGLAPLQAIQNIAVINGKPSVYGDALMAMVRGSPACEDVIERFEGEGDGLAAVCEARRKGKAPVLARFSVADAKKANLWGKSGPWQQYPRRMLQMRARGFALRDAFPDVLRGVITREEAEDYPVDVSKPREMIDVTLKTDLDQFAAGASHDVRLTAEKMALHGTEAFREWWKTLNGDQRVAIRPDIPAYQRIAEQADARMASDRDDGDPFGLDEIRPQEAPDAIEGSVAAQSPPAGEPHSPAGQPERNDLGGSASQPVGEPDLLATIRAELAAAETPARCIAIQQLHTNELQQLSVPQYKAITGEIEARKQELREARQ